MKPNTFLIGAPKCGTSALASYLAMHPNVFMSIYKESHFWTEEFDKSFPGGCRSLGDYERLFEPASSQHLRLLDASTSYVYSRYAVSRILEYNPDAKFIVMFRNPIDVVHAFHMELLIYTYEDVVDFETAWNLQETRRAGKQLPVYSPCDLQLQYGYVASFGQHLQRIRSIIPQGNLLVIIHDDFCRNPALIYQQVMAFLAIPTDNRKEFPKVNESRQPRFKAVKDVIQHPPGILQPFEVLFRSLSWRLGMRGLRQKFLSCFDKKSMRSPLSADFHRHLCDVFRADVLHLGEQLSRDLTHWTRYPANESNRNEGLERALLQEVVEKGGT